MNKPVAAAALLALTMALTACGNDDAKAAQSISDSIMKDQKSDSADSPLTMKRSQANCFGTKLVDRVGTDQLQKYKILDKNLHVNEKVTDVKMSVKDANSTADTLFDCTDVMAGMKKAMTQQQMPPAVKSCLDKALSKDKVHAMFAAMFEGKQNEASKGLTDSITKCAMAG